MSTPSTLFITGAAGFIGARVLEHFIHTPAPFERIVAADIRDFPEEIKTVDHVETRILDIRDSQALRDIFLEFRPQTVIHLAAMVTPPPGDHRKLQYEVDVLGTRHVVAAALEAGTEHFIYTSSGAAYGYHPDNPIPLTEDEVLRGNEIFAYSHHKRLVEEDLAIARRDHPQLKQLIFRVSTVLGPTTNNQITSLFEQKVVTGIAGSDAPFCIIADDDVVAAILQGIKTDQSGIFNLTGDGILKLSEIAEMMGGRYVALPEAAVRTALGALSTFKLAPYGPEQVLFLKHRPVLDNTRLKRDFGFEPRYTTEEAFQRYRKARAPVVLITGAAGSLGSTLALKHGLAGHRIILVDRNSTELERIYLKLRAHGIDAHPVQADITDINACRRAVDAARQRFGRLDILYNNAAIPLRGAAREVSPEDVERILDVNLMGAIRITDAALELLPASAGRIAVISSVAGFAPLTGRSAYAAAKHALHGYFESLRTEVEPDGVSVTLVCPAYLKGNFRKDAADGARELNLDDAAEEILHGVMRRKDRLLIGTTAQLAWWVSRLAPALYEDLMRRSVKEEFPL